MHKDLSVCLSLTIGAHYHHHVFMLHLGFRWICSHVLVVMESGFYASTLHTGPMEQASSFRTDRSYCTTMGGGWTTPPPCPSRPMWTPCSPWSAARAASVRCCARSAHRSIRRRTARPAEISRAGGSETSTKKIG